MLSKQVGGELMLGASCAAALTQVKAEARAIDGCRWFRLDLKPRLVRMREIVGKAAPD